MVSSSAVLEPSATSVRPLFALSISEALLIRLLSPVCDSANGYASNASKTACIAKSVDVNNCGAEGNVCPSSYNGVGVATCRASKCRLSESLTFTLNSGRPPS